MARTISPINLTRAVTPRDPFYFLRAGILVGVLVVSVLAAFLLSPDQMPYILILIGAAAGGLIIMRWPGLGFIIAIAGGMIVPDVGPKNLNLPMVMVAGLFVIWLADMAVRHRKIRVVASRTMLPLIAFAFISLLAFGLGQFPWYRFTHNAPMDAQLGGLAVNLISFLAFVLMANQITELKWLQAITWSFIAIGSIHIIVRVVPGLQVLNKAIFLPQAIGGVFWAWFPTLAFGQMLINRDLHPALRVFLGLMVLGGLYMGVGQTYDWKSGWVPPLVGIAVVVLIYSWRMGLFIAIAGAYPAYKLLGDALVGDDYSVSTRLEAWIILQEIVKVNPILGLGFGNYYWYTPLFPIRGFAVTFNSHNNFVDTVAQTGLAGLAAFLWLLIEIGLVGIKLLQRVPAGFPRAYVYGALGGLAATAAAGMLGDWVLPFVYNIGFSGVRTGILAWIFLGGLVMLENLYRSED